MAILAGLAIGFALGAGAAWVTHRQPKILQSKSVNHRGSQNVPAPKDRFSTLLGTVYLNESEAGELHQLLSDIVTKDPSKFLHLLGTKMPDSLILDYLPRFAEALASRDADSTATAINSIPGYLQRRILAEQVLELKFKDDPAAALLLSDKIKGTLFTMGPKGYIDRSMEIFTEVDPVQAAKYASAQPTSHTALPTVLNHWIEFDPQAAVKWMKENAPDEPLSRYTDKLLAANSGEKAASLWEKAKSLGISDESAVVSIAGKTAYTDPEGTLAWLGTLEDVSAREKGMSICMTQIARTLTPEQLNATLSALPSVSAQRSMIQTWAVAGGATQPEKTLEAVGLIQRKDLQLSARQETLAVWAAKDFPAAVKWLQSHPEVNTPALMGRVELFKPKMK